MKITRTFLIIGWMCIAVFSSSVYAANSGAGSTAGILFANPNDESLYFYRVEVIDSFAAEQTVGAGSYNKGDSVTINSGVRIGYEFDGWQVNYGGISFVNPKTSVKTFTMPNMDVSVTAKWKTTTSSDDGNNGDDGGGGDNNGGDNNGGGEGGSGGDSGNDNSQDNNNSQDDNSQDNNNDQGGNSQDNNNGQGGNSQDNNNGQGGNNQGDNNGRGGNNQGNNNDQGGNGQGNNNDQGGNGQGNNSQGNSSNGQGIGRNRSAAAPPNGIPVNNRGNTYISRGENFPPLLVEPVALVSPMFLEEDLNQLITESQPEQGLPAELRWIEDAGIPRIGFGDGRELLLFAPFGADSWSLLSLILASAGAALAIMLAIRVVLNKRRERREEDVSSGYNEFDEENPDKKQRPVYLATAFVMGILGVFIFLLTQDMTKTIVLVNIWTVANVIIFVIEAAATVLIQKREKNGEQKQRIGKRPAFAATL